MTKEEINKLQEQYNYAEMQKLIDTGDVWKFEGSMGRSAMNCLESGICYLPEKQTFDYYKNILPSRNELQAGTKGTIENSEKFWQSVVDQEIMFDVPDEEY